MIVGAAAVPTAPSMVAGVSGTLPPEVIKVADAIDHTLESLPAYDLAVLLGPALELPHGLYTFDEVDLGGIGRPDVGRAVKMDREATEAISRVTQYTLHRGGPVPLSLAVLALLTVQDRPLVALAVPQRAGFESLVAVGTGIAEAVGDSEHRAIALACGDLSAALTEKSPRFLVDGAAEWDEAVVATVDSGRLDGLRDHGPEEALRVHAIGWSSLAVLHGVCARAKVGLAVRQYSAPRGVGYLVASGR